jgi:hypothetical protein
MIIPTPTSVGQPAKGEQVSEPMVLSERKMSKFTSLRLVYPPAAAPASRRLVKGDQGKDSKCQIKLKGPMPNVLDFGI